MMASNHTDSGHEFFLPPSSPAPNPHYQQPRKRRTKLIKIDQNLVLSGPGGSSASTPTDAATASRPKCNGKKPDPSAPKITRPCTECGKKFWSWKALFGHMRCHPERQWRGINPPPNLRRPVPDQVEVQQRFCDDDDVIDHCAAAAPLMTAEDHEVAASLLLLACTTDDQPTATTTTTTTISLENYQTGAVVSFDHNDIDVQVQEEQQGRFECSSCKKVFGSHQALGGHRASHKNVKGCFAITRTSDGCDQVVVGDDQQTGSRSSDNDVIMREMNVEDNMLMQMGHRCGICFRVFSSGQALGGHKRCHWEKGEEASSSSMNVNAVVAAAAAAQEGRGLDLNLPAPVEDHSETSSFYNSSSSAAAARAAPTLDLRLGL